jgi:hypothetical protein
MPIEPLTKIAIETFIQQQAIWPLKLDPRNPQLPTKQVVPYFPSSKLLAFPITSYVLSSQEKQIRARLEDSVRRCITILFVVPISIHLQRQKSGGPVDEDQFGRRFQFGQNPSILRVTISPVPSIL